MLQHVYKFIIRYTANCFHAEFSYWNRRGPQKTSFVCHKSYVFWGTDSEIIIIKRFFLLSISISYFFEFVLKCILHVFNFYYCWTKRVLLVCNTTFLLLFSCAQKYMLIRLKYTAVYVEFVLLTSELENCENCVFSKQ